MTPEQVIAKLEHDGLDLLIEDWPDYDVDAAVGVILAALKASVRPEAERKMEPWMIDEVIKYLSGKGSFRDDYQGLTVNSSLIRWKDELGPQQQGKPE